MRLLLVAIWLGLTPLTSALAQVTIQFNLPGVSIGVVQPAYPRLVQVPGYPVYYDPGADSNYFFYDGYYWVYQGDEWYSSAWYDGPWALMMPQSVPVFVLRVPVRYYRRPPPYFRGWIGDAPPRWGEHWGPEWEHQRSGWDQWDRHRAPPPAPLPVYQRQYSGKRYPSPEEQHALRVRNYRYEPRNPVVKQFTPARPPPPAAPPPRAAEPSRRERPAERAEPQRQQAPAQQPQPTSSRSTSRPQPRSRRTSRPRSRSRRSVPSQRSAPKPRTGAAGATPRPTRARARVRARARGRGETRTAAATAAASTASSPAVRG